MDVRVCDWTSKLFLLVTSLPSISDLGNVLSLSVGSPLIFRFSDSQDFGVVVSINPRCKSLTHRLYETFLLLWTDWTETHSSTILRKNSERMFWELLNPPHLNNLNFTTTKGTTLLSERLNMCFLIMYISKSYVVFCVLLCSVGLTPSRLCYFTC